MKTLITKIKLTKTCLFFLLSTFLLSCATYRPVLDENDHYLKVGDAMAEKDIDDCMFAADRYLEKHKSERLGKEVGRQAVGGAILGGVIGAITGDTRNAIAGAAGGAAVGAGGAYLGEKSKDNLKPDALKQQYVTKCLERKKYNIIGWK